MSSVAPVLPSVSARGATMHESVSWRAPLGLLLAVLFWIIAWHGEAAVTMATIWWRSETFAHGLIIYPVAAWLVWRVRPELSRLPVRTNYWVLLLLGLAELGWLLGEFGGVAAARQLCLVAMIPLAVWAILGTVVARAIAFPLAFTLLAVPVGEFMLPTLMEYTADFTVFALRLTGIPVYREGLFFTIPSGNWSVVEACSGLRYLIASITLGCLFAYLTYRTLWRRVLFIIAAALVPIIANWLRAYLIVMLGHLSGMKIAVGVDHLLYGWLFFGLVMLGLFWVGSRWREEQLQVDVAGMVVSRSTSCNVSGTLYVALAVAAIAALGPTYSQWSVAELAGADPKISVPRAAAGWVPVDASIAAFKPHFLGARSQIHQVYERDGRRVALFIGYFVNQREGAEMISFRNGVLNSSDIAWRKLSSARRSAVAGDLIVVHTSIRSESTRLAVWHWYWVAGRTTIREEFVKLVQAGRKLMRSGDETAVVVLYALDSEVIVGRGEETLRQFANDMGPSILVELEGVRARSVVARASVSRSAP